ncbi:unnamed protein product [Angiostrongylus costaricensis]|uniref:Uncharacterized protein n=1 Tax=Angiostrongylus costaricensis TaxID=334426 RepID=A0A0R3PXT6_ANGCS|nr:unnamed protein product [Angiostrongylus costaricensis]
MRVEDKVLAMQWVPRFLLVGVNPELRRIRQYCSIAHSDTMRSTAVVGGPDCVCGGRERRDGGQSLGPPINHWLASNAFVVSPSLPKYSPS